MVDPRSESTDTMGGERPINLQIYEIILNLLIVVILSLSNVVCFKDVYEFG